MENRSHMNPGLANMTYATLIIITGPTKATPAQPIGNWGDALCLFAFAVVRPNNLPFPLALGQTIFFLLGYRSLHLLKIAFMNANRMDGPYTLWMVDANNAPTNVFLLLNTLLLPLTSYYEPQCFPLAMINTSFQALDMTLLVYLSLLPPLSLRS